MTKAEKGTTMISDLFRREQVKMTAVLCRHFGIKDLDFVEDIIAETFLRATEVWPHSGIPENPSGWLYTVAKNIAKDSFRKKASETKKFKTLLDSNPQETVELSFNEHVIVDSHLAMIFAVCENTLSPKGKICLSLQILCGLSVEEIAFALQSNKEAVKKILFRAREQLRESNFEIKYLSSKEIQQRMDSVLLTVYLLFNEGYASKTKNSVIRTDLIKQAMNLGLSLLETKPARTPELLALMSLFCFQASRLDSRMSAEGSVVVFEDQDKSKWDQNLIHKGNEYFLEAFSTPSRSRYHYEAAIAYWHTQEDSLEKWKYILNIYDNFSKSFDSPAVSLNRVFAYSKVYGNPKALEEIKSYSYEESRDYHSLIGYLYTNSNKNLASLHYQKAIQKTKSKKEIAVLEKKIKELNLKEKVSL
ncbi:sigma-70 family RNA polymerase sigma factor [Leptospira sp. 2 VSF19]|uniref:Sigma-70 family RNA polymerase sigma factor n=1 Tax=Leptospira soteropolitanensis TaxID=2950025 RepID=A0AAW5VGS7_9LEPT|nr:sigma-70 family RNA polymerase sigma factor [Leptospira soteropolitanensis]MCW7494270.1 sigma-70 family RNA polymerase sigma factor [Leptospira soteropolitanensis]MCW7501755.1 sigma-70 family RNA polymerase sigma factor [Leptospira soteropolitanensis]MCW7524116.1 sigma-70 family RNA polymerase sigma factor [Leptospira soteropolitanensis]MCW7527981.1 sigma-70 family RNA polymerase sigma factor [Leptospira soteropolitanensis]MCW7531725.1 sigma-70 family RNA polymerase sigma factor [Leptospira